MVKLYPSDYLFIGAIAVMIIASGLMLLNRRVVESHSFYVPLTCDDIIRYEDGSMVCEININAEDDVAPQAITQNTVEI